jgi:hypothetical protein
LAWFAFPQASRYDPHNIAVRAAAGDRGAAKASLHAKIGAAAAGMNPRSMGPAGTAALRTKGLSAGDFKYLCMRCLSLDLTDAELSEAVFEFGDPQGLVDGLKFMVKKKGTWHRMRLHQSLWHAGA